MFVLKLLNNSARCGGMLFCFMETFDKAFKNFGGIGGWIELHAP